MVITPEQFERWRDFALRMARTCFKKRRRPSAKEIEANVQDFFDNLEPETVAKIVDWDNSDKDGPLICDLVSEQSDSWNPYYWRDLSEAEWERRDDQFCSPVQCCIRAGLDLAVAPSAGVMGFTAGDLRRMYPEGVPDWVTGGEDHRWTTQHFDGVIPGVGLVPGKRELNGTFGEMADNASLWL